MFNQTYRKRYKFALFHPKMSSKSLVLGELCFARMPLSCNCMKMNEIQFWNYLPKSVDSSQDGQYGVVTQDG